MADRTKTANYRRCCLTDGQGNDASDGKTLQHWLQDALLVVKRPWVRGLGLSDGHHLLTDLVVKNSCLCGEIVYYERGRRIPLVDTEDDGTTWRASIEPKDSSGKARQFQEQSLVFAVRENHVAIIQSQLLQVSELQEFLAWFIQEKAGFLKSSLIALENLPSKAALEKLKDHKIKGIRFGDRLFTNVREEVPPTPGAKPTKRKKYVHRLETSPQIFQVLLGLGLGQPILEKLARNPDPGAIQVDVEIRYRSRSEKEASAVLHSLAATLGKQDGLQTEIQLDGKSTIKGDDLTIRGNILVQCHDGCISVDDAFSKLARWLADQITSGKVL